MKALRSLAVMLVVGLTATSLVGLQRSINGPLARAALASDGVFGDGSDGPLTISADFVDSPIDSACWGAAGGYALDATNASFAAGQRILIHQTQGSGAGNWEINTIASYDAGIISLVDRLEGSYSSSGSNKAQVMLLKQYTDVTLNAGVTWTAKAWNGATGGILAFCANGIVSVAGTIQANGGNGSALVNGKSTGGAGSGGGFRGGNAVTSEESFYSWSGEGTIGASAQQYTANGSGGGGSYHSHDAHRFGGGGGGHATGGSGGGRTAPEGNGGVGGGTSGTVDLTTMTFGGGGGGSSVTSHDTGNTYNAGGGGAGGGVIAMFAATVTVTGAIHANGGPGGGNPTPPGAGGGGGAGGSILIRAQTATLGTTRLTATGGIGGTPPELDANGGAGGVGRIRIEYYDTYSGSTNPPASVAQLEGTPTPTPTATQTPTDTPMPTPTATDTAAPTATNTPTPTITDTLTPTDTAIATARPTNTPTRTGSPFSARLFLPLILKRKTVPITPIPTSTPTLTPTPEELRYDDGERDAGSVSCRGAGVAVRFTVASPRQVTAIKYHLGGDMEQMRLLLLDAEWTELYREDLVPSVGPGADWFELQVPAPITVTGDFYVALQWPADDQKGPNVGVDYDPPYSGRSYFLSSFDPRSWQQRNDRNYMIRVSVQ